MFVCLYACCINNLKINLYFLGIPHFHDLSEVISNSTRICLATHFDERCVTACVTLSIAIALMLQVK